MGKAEARALGRWVDAELAAARKGQPRSATIRRPCAPGTLPRIASQVIEYWVRGQSYRWLAQRFGVDKNTAHRWVRKHPHEVERWIDELGWVAQRHIQYLPEQVALAHGWYLAWARGQDSRRRAPHRLEGAAWHDGS